MTALRERPGRRRARAARTGAGPRNERALERTRALRHARPGQPAAPAALGLLDRKRLELARALATDPQVLLLDEIGGGLTDAEADELVATIQQLRADGIAIVWIEHIVHVLLQVVDRLVCMDAGPGHRRRRAGRRDVATPWSSTPTSGGAA